MPSTHIHWHQRMESGMPIAAENVKLRQAADRESKRQGNSTAVMSSIGEAKQLPQKKKRTQAAGRTDGGRNNNSNGSSSEDERDFGASGDLKK